MDSFQDIECHPKFKYKNEYEDMYSTALIWCKRKVDDFETLCFDHLKHYKGLKSQNIHLQDSIHYIVDS